MTMNNQHAFSSIPFLLTLLVSLSGCADMFFSHDDSKLARETMKSVRGAAKGPASVFRIINRARVVAGHLERLCAGEVNSQNNRYLCAVRQPSGETEWRLGGGAMQEIALKSMSSAGESVADFEIDRQWRYLVVVTAEEGHPCLAVYDLNRWLATLNQPSALVAVNPCPGGLHLLGWENNQRIASHRYGNMGLRFDSDGPVLEGENADSNIFPLPEMREFHVSVPDMRDAESWKIKFIKTDVHEDP